MIVYTLKTCDTCRKALKWLDDEEIAYTNHDVRADGLDEATVRNVVTALGAEKAVNKRSTTWRGLSDEQKQGLTDDSAMALILANPTLMKRPVFDRAGHYLAGFDAKVQGALKAG
ncbi:MAG: Spx/MgsR family RNA polymerase-binding regulatory protein [Pseudomonadota bacterium]